MSLVTDEQLLFILDEIFQQGKVDDHLYQMGQVYLRTDRFYLYINTEDNKQKFGSLNNYRNFLPMQLQLIESRCVEWLKSYSLKLIRDNLNLDYVDQVIHNTKFKQKIISSLS